MIEDVFPGHSEMAWRMRELDWSRTSLGPVEQWPQSLRTSVSTCLDCAFPIILARILGQRARSGVVDRAAAHRNARRHDRGVERRSRDRRHLPRETAADDASGARAASGFGPRGEPRAPEIPAVDLHDVRVLAVDDERDALSLVAEVLEAAGARVTMVSSAPDALARLDVDVPDVIVADLGMPQMDGYQFIDRVRRHRNVRVRELPAAALTAYARSDDRMKALRAGFHIHLAKPIDPAELVTTIAALANRFMARRDRPSDVLRS